MRAGNVVIQLPWAVTVSAWILAQVSDMGDALDRLREGEQFVERQAARGLIVTCGWTTTRSGAPVCCSVA